MDVQHLLIDGSCEMRIIDTLKYDSKSNGVHIINAKFLLTTNKMVTQKVIYVFTINKTLSTKFLIMNTRDKIIQDNGLLTKFLCLNAST